MRPFLINHTDKNTEQKVNYFLNYFLFINSQIGYNPQFHLDNHLSILKKIKYQFENNSKRKRKVYVKNHMEQFLKLEKFAIKGFEECILLIEEFSKQESSIQYDYILINNLVCQCIQVLEKDLVYFKKLVSRVSWIIRCPHKLKTHKKEINSLTKLLVSKYRLLQYTQMEIQSFPNRIMSSYDYTFPYSDNDLHNKNFGNFDFDKQFNGFINLIKNVPKEYNFIFKVVGLNLTENSLYTYNIVTFTSPKHPTYLSLSEKLMIDVNGKNFFGDHEYSLAIIKIKHISRNFAIERARKIVDNELNYLNLVLNRQAIVEKTHHFLFNNNLKISSFPNKSCGNNSKVDLNKENFKLIKNAFQRLAEVSQFSKNEFLSFESLFVNAYNLKNTALLWSYFECLTPNMDQSTRIDTLSSLLVYAHTFFTKRDLNRCLNVAVGELSTFDIKDIKLSKNRIREIEFDEKIKPHTYIKDIPVNFIQEIYRNYKKCNWNAELINAQNNYKSILLECYEHRNQLIHTGYLNQSLNAKVAYLLPILVSRIRNAYVDMFEMFNGDTLSVINEKARIHIKKKHNLV